MRLGKNGSTGRRRLFSSCRIFVMGDTGGVFKEILSLDGGINALLYALFGQKIHFMASNELFPGILVVTDVWKGMGYNMIIIWQP